MKDIGAKWRGRRKQGKEKTSGAAGEGGEKNGDASVCAQTGFRCFLRLADVLGWAGFIL